MPHISRRAHYKGRYHRVVWLLLLAFTVFLAWKLFSYPLTDTPLHR